MLIVDAPATFQMIDEAQIRGEAHTGFEKAGDLGEFECGNCSYMVDGCNHPMMMKYSRQPRLSNGHVQVDEEDCCEYVDRVGRTDTDIINHALDSLSAVRTIFR